MSILWVNLKHFYQRRGLWLWYLFLFPWLFFAFFFQFFFRSHRHEYESYVGFFFLSFFVGVITADLQRDVLAKPFSFCLPKHRSMPKHLIFGIGSIVNLLVGIIFFGNREPLFPHDLLVILAAGFVGMIFYLLAVRLVFVFRTGAFIGPILAFIWVIPMVLSQYNRPAEYIIISHPLWPIMAGIITCRIAWKWLEGDALARKHCGDVRMGLADAWNVAKMRKYQQKQYAQMLSKGRPSISDSLEGFFLTRMETCASFSKYRAVLGNLYIMLGRLFGGPRWVWTLTTPLLIVMILSLGYFANGIMSNYVFLSPAFMVFYLDLVPHRNILLPLGRTEKYYTAVASGFVITVMVTLLFAMLAAMSVLLGPMLPDIPWKGATYAYYAMDVRQSYIGLFLMPIALVIGTLFPNRRLPLFLFMGGAVSLCGPRFGPTPGPPLLASAGIPGVVVSIAASWITFILLLRYHCLRKSLVGQTR